MTLSLEKGMALAFAAHGGDYNSGTRGSLDLAFAIFMLAKNGVLGQPKDSFSWSTGGYWETKDWSWDETEALYTGDYGAPKAAAVLTGSVWRREFERCVVTVDCATLRPEIRAAHTKLAF